SAHECRHSDRGLLVEATVVETAVRAGAMAAVEGGSLAVREAKQEAPARASSFSSFSCGSRWHPQGLKGAGKRPVPALPQRALAQQFAVSPSSPRTGSIDRS